MAAEDGRPPVPRGLQLDLVTAIIRLQQVDDELAAENDPFAWWLLRERIIRCDLPRLRAYLEPDTIRWAVAEAGGLGIAPPRLSEPISRRGWRRRGMHAAPPRRLRLVDDGGREAAT